MKIPIKVIQNLIDDAEFDDMGTPLVDDKWIPYVIGRMSNSLGIDKRYIRIWWCGPVSEYCVYIHDKWSGYLDLNEYGNGMDGASYE